MAASVKPESARLYKSAVELIPGGVNSPVRAFKSVGGNPIFFEKGEGAFLFSADGVKYIDYVLSWGPLILGHAHPEVIETVTEVSQLGTSFGAPSKYEIALAKKIVTHVPSVEKVRFVNSGTEATMSAIRLARGFTGRTKIVKFDGCYHGHGDSFLVKAGSGAALFNDTAMCPGVPSEISNLTVSLPYNNIDAVERIFETSGEKIAAVIVEPVAANMGVVPPVPGFLNTLREITESYGSVLIFDEVITGFRLGLGGAQQLFGIKPDLTCFGKIIGGGFPVGAYGGKSEIMSLIAPEGPVYQAGTLSGNPVAMAAGAKTIEILEKPETYKNLDSISEYFAKGLSTLLKTYNVEGRVQRMGSLMTLFYTNEEVKDFAGASSQDQKYFKRIFHELLKKGIYTAPSSFEAMFLSVIHNKDLIDQTLNVYEDTFRSVNKE